MTNKAAGLGTLILVALSRPSFAAAQATNPPYLSEFPTVERVKKAMQVSDPRETALRQMGALWQLQEIIKALSGHREFRGFLPDEGRIVGAYGVAQYYIGQAVDSAFPGPYGSARKVSDNTPYMYMRTDPRFGVEGIEVFKILLPPAVQDLYYQAVAPERARVLARAKSDSVDREQGLARMTAPAGAQPTAPGQPQSHLADEQRQIRRCVESGRSEIQCMMEGIGKSWNEDFIGAIAPGLKKAAIYGVRVAGVYPGPGKFSLSFYNESVNLTCADLQPLSQNYATVATNNGLRIEIENQPQPLVLGARADGQLVGPASADITGQVIVGYQEGVRTWSDGRTEPISRPIYETRTRRCNVGTLATSGPSSALGSMSTAPAAAVNLIFGSPDKDAGKPAPAGLRMSGEYGSQAGLDLEFRPEGVVVGCREAVILRLYTVQPQGTRVVISVENSASPFSVTLGPDGRLSGSGTVRVDGRVVSGTAPNGDIAYAPRSASCGLAVLAPAGQSTGQPAPDAPIGAAGPTPTGTLGPAAAAIVKPAPGTGAVFQLESGFTGPAGSPNPIAGQGFMLLDSPLDKIVKEAGVAQPAGLSATKALEHACTTAAGATDCDKLVATMNAHQVAFLRPDQGGVAQSPELPAGRSYYLFGAAITGGRKFTWHLPLVAKVGWTKVTLTQANAVPN